MIKIHSLKPVPLLYAAAIASSIFLLWAIEKAEMQDPTGILHFPSYWFGGGGVQYIFGVLMLRHEIVAQQSTARSYRIFLYFVLLFPLVIAITALGYYQLFVLTPQARINYSFLKLFPFAIVLSSPFLILVGTLFDRSPRSPWISWYPFLISVLGGIFLLAGLGRIDN